MTLDTYEHISPVCPQHSCFATLRMKRKRKKIVHSWCIVCSPPSPLMDFESTPQRIHLFAADSNTLLGGGLFRGRGEGELSFGGGVRNGCQGTNELNPPPNSFSKVGFRPPHGHTHTRTHTHTTHTHTPSGLIVDPGLQPVSKSRFPVRFLKTTRTPLALCRASSSQGGSGKKPVWRGGGGVTQVSFQAAAKSFPSPKLQLRCP